MHKHEARGLLCRSNGVLRDLDARSPPRFSRLAVDSSCVRTLLYPINDLGVRWAAFAVASYVFGHVLHHVGAVLDKWYDEGYARHERRFGEEGLLRASKELMATDLKANSDGVSTFLGGLLGSRTQRCGGG